MNLLLLFLISSAWAVQPLWWNSGTGLVDKHEFYPENEAITKPADSWQMLFAVTHTGKDLADYKDCVFYRVPGVEAGEVKIKTVSMAEDCQKHFFEKGDLEYKEAKSLSYRLSEQGFTLSFTQPNYHSEKWDVTFVNPRTLTQPKLLTSSAEYKGLSLVMLSPVEGKGRPATVLSDGDVCHQVSDDCEEASPSTCSLCPTIWYEIPNGCPQSPKWCGEKACGGKDQPACRRGMKWQRKEKSYTCREDSSFAYCRPGLKVNCEGALAYCR